jgi:hypothetical protein
VKNISLIGIILLFDGKWDEVIFFIHFYYCYYFGLFGHYFGFICKLICFNGAFYVGLYGSAEVILS